MSRFRSSLHELFDVLHVGLELNTAEEIRSACGLILRTEELTSAARDTLRACYDLGPVWDGDLPSKSGRDELEDLGMVQGVVVKGEEGYNACTYMGARAYRLLEVMRDAEKLRTNSRRLREVGRREEGLQDQGGQDLQRDQEAGE